MVCEVFMGDEAFAFLEWFSSFVSHIGSTRRYFAQMRWTTGSRMKIVQSGDSDELGLRRMW